ncbi:MAG: MotA/TolQ/ExbB proton channel family protein [Candidatus Eisenbacteria bacterium]
MDLLSGFAAFFRNGGPFMFVILAIGVVALAIILERFWTIGRAGSIDSRKLLKDLEGRISQGDLVGALSLSKQVNGPVAHVASSVLSSDMRNDDRIYNAAESAATIVLPPLSRRLALLGVLANTATLLGLLGTIFGLTTAFSAVGAADPAQRSAFLAAGISQALNTTSFGLIVAIPTLLAHSFLVGKVESIVEQVEETTARITQAILRAGRHSA